jgi:hypothetical protein
MAQINVSRVVYGAHPHVETMSLYANVYFTVDVDGYQEVELCISVPSPDSKSDDQVLSEARSELRNMLERTISVTEQWSQS